MIEDAAKDEGRGSVGNMKELSRRAEDAEYLKTFQVIGCEVD